MAKGKMTKGQTMIYKTLQRKLKIEQHEPAKPVGSPEGKTVPVSLVTFQK